MRPLASLPPQPSGWYVVGAGSDLCAGQTRASTLFGNELVLYRTAAGVARAAGAYCPHMGAHLGHSGAVEGETLRCRFHGFRFDRTGACVATAYGTRPPRRACLQMWPLRETHGLLLVWADPLQRPPQWEVPDLSTEGWSPLVWHSLRFRGHPQETTENSVDIGHLAEVHGYRDVELVRDVRVDGPYLNGLYRMARPIGPSWLGLAARAEFEVHVYGLGYSRVDVNLYELGVRMRQFVFATPVGDGEVELRLAISVADTGSTRLAGPLQELAGPPLARVVARLVMAMYIRDVGQDVPIWTHKTYVHPPVLALGDGPVIRYRRWARQFYPQVEDVPRRERRGETPSGSG